MFPIRRISVLLKLPLFCNSTGFNQNLAKALSRLMCTCAGSFRSPDTKLESERTFSQYRRHRCLSILLHGILISPTLTLPASGAAKTTVILTPARYIFSPPFTEHVPASENWYQERFGSLKPHVRTTITSAISFALPLHRNNDGFQSRTDPDVVMREPEVWEAKIAIGPVPGSPAQIDLRNDYCANHGGYQ